ncbi:Acetyltransferase (GNAT) family protein [Maioricimonas rarisocia]|uniref:Acetyltransferase (GNAT) family protein n=1 Tax=Maioricimonas rarisocia TaxID=2528026 RepID=A0A517ZD58_9PLAN|nr:GNAT family N-acetyltransferase [Maioricimonas rarisocia]QDU40424.1 Acetyltransferase (GNAT) family protein [Maioricimonas rarisocia]
MPGPAASDNDLTIRAAHPDDWPTLVDFNCRLAEESEGQILDRETVAVGVKALLADAHKGRYFVACRSDRIIGQLMHTREWSDWRNGDIWWLQSVYVRPEERGRGVLRALYNHLQQLAEAATDPRVVGLRLYMEQGNDLARTVYTQLGLRPAGYEVLERIPSRS